ncbi:hypothetical protein QAD02_002906 [Eretmocerus hayati]|uniref:Uncharacterized protein n=1 Tax=Eretmocerus hayati TaxID=131215 RepID=A0ACC2NKM5_9HYME|nr:hypothetical protein QAD02_002906 [Eretmocerus hayati]
MDNYEKRLGESEKRARKNNLIMIGKKMDRMRLKEKVEQWLEKDIQVTCRIIKAWEMRKNKEEMIGMECENSDKWEEIMIKKSKLKGTDRYIEKDLTWQEREIRRKLKGFAEEQMDKGKETIVRDNHVIISEQIWRWSDREIEPFRTGKE